VAGEDGAEHGREDRDSSAIIEEALAVEDRLQACGRVDLAQQVDDRDRVGGRDDSPQEEPARPIEAEQDVREHADEQHRQKYAHGGEQADGHDATPHLSEVEVERRLEDEARHEDEEDQVRTDGRKAQARNQADDDAADRQQHRVRHEERSP
jgi:hypothetical protein